MGKHRGSDRDRKDGGSLTVKLLIVCVVVLVAVDGINRQHELVVESPHIIQLPPPVPQYKPTSLKKKKKPKPLPAPVVEDPFVEASIDEPISIIEGDDGQTEVGVGSDFGEGAEAVADQTQQESFQPVSSASAPASPKPKKPKEKKEKKSSNLPKLPNGEIDIGSIRPTCGSSRCRKRAAQLRSQLRRERREAQALLLFPIRDDCGYNSTKELLISGPQDVVMSGDSWKGGGRLKMPKVIPPPGDLKSNISLWLSQCPTFKSLFVGSVNNQLIESGIIPDTDPLKFHVRNKHDSCAIVGNGGGLLLAPLGSAIDKHEAVFRFNGGPTFGFEENVGKRTSYRLDNSQHFLFHEPGTNEIILQHVTNREMFNQVKEEAVIMVTSATSDLRVHIIDPMFHHYVMNVNKIGAPSNGFFGIVLSHLICNQITLFGYQKDWRNQSIPYHYYDEVEPILGQWDRDNREKHQLEATIDMINEIAEESSEWNHWKQISGWSYEKMVYAEERYPSFFMKEIPEKFKVYHQTAPGATLPPLDENGNPILPPEEGEGLEGVDPPEEQPVSE